MLLKRTDQIQILFILQILLQADIISQAFHIFILDIQDGPQMKTLSFHIGVQFFLRVFSHLFPVYAEEDQDTDHHCEQKNTDYNAIVFIDFFPFQIFLHKLFFPFWFSFFQ